MAKNKKSRGNTPAFIYVQYMFNILNAEGDL